jgi:hypothetical protein
VKLKKRKKTWAERRSDQGKIGLITKAQEHLVGCAIRREGVEHGKDARFHSHAELRRSLGDISCYDERPGDEHGFWTSKGRFVGRIEAGTIAALAGQAPHTYQGRAILSSDINWRTK